MQDNTTPDPRPIPGRATHAERREARQDRLDARAGALQRGASARYRAASAAVEGIPPGQPILVGHHSERRHRRDLEKHDTNMRAGIELARKAERIAAVNPTTAVLATDADGAAVIQQRIDRAEALQLRMKAANAVVRKGDCLASRTALAAQGFTAEAISGLFTKDFAGRLGFPGYALTNNSANIRSMRARLAQLAREATIEPSERMVGDVRVVEDPDAMRLRLVFPGKPSPELRTRLKASGFRWAPTEGAWQRQLTNAARHAVGYVLQADKPTE